jgi:Mrp family chromosome partitioning ATPase
MDRTLAAKFQILRARIESDLKPGSVILVTSALPGDGKSVTAYGLADCLAQIGRRVALVDGSATARSANPSPYPLDAAKMPIVPLPFDELETRRLGASIGTFVAKMRSEYDFTLIDGAAFMRSSVPMLLASAVDGVLLTVRLGRAQTDDDLLMCQMLGSAKANLLGVVAVSAESIAPFGPPPESSPQADVRRGRSGESVDANVAASTRLMNAFLNAYTAVVAYVTRRFVRTPPEFVDARALHGRSDSGQ